MHQLVEAQKRRGPGLFLEVVRDPLRTPPDAMFALVARRADAAGVGRACPCLGGVGLDVLEAVQATFDALAGRVRARGDVADSGVVRRSDVINYKLIIERLLRHKELRK